MSLFDDLKTTLFGGIQKQVADQVEQVVQQVTEKIPGELDDKIAEDVVQSVEENLGIPQDAADKTSKK